MILAVHGGRPKAPHLTHRQQIGTQGAPLALDLLFPKSQLLESEIYIDVLDGLLPSDELRLPCDPTWTKLSQIGCLLKVTNLSWVEAGALL